MKKLITLCMIFYLSLSLCTGVQAQTILLSFAGDCTLGGDESWFSLPESFMSVVASKGYTYPLDEVRQWFMADDFTLVNLEGVLKDDGKSLRAGRKWNFRGLTAYTAILQEGGVEAVNLGNNHSYDYGAEGLASTKAALTEAGIGYCIDREVLIFEKEEIRIAFLGFNMDHYNHLKEYIEETIPALKTQGCQAVVVSIHAGTEYEGKHNSTQRDLARHAIDCGADLVIGHHPHVLQGMELYKERTIFYSLGGFTYGGNRRPRTVEFPSVVAQVALSFDSSGYAAQTVTLRPVYISGTRPQNNYQPCPVTGKEAQEVLQHIQKDTNFALQPYQEGKGAVQETVYALRGGE